MDADRYYLFPPPAWHSPRAYPGGEHGPLGDLTENLKKLGGDGDYRKAACFPGGYHPRVWRGIESPAPVDTGHGQAVISSLLVCHQMASHLRDMLYCIHPDIAHFNVYGHRQRELLLLSCTEVESAWRSILRENQSNPVAPLGPLTTNVYVKLKEPMRLDKWSIELTYFPQIGPLTPFSEWDDRMPTPSLPWYHAYNSVKHDREGSIHFATLGHVVNAIAAFYIMVLAQFGAPYISETTLSVNDFKVTNCPEWNLEDYYTRPMLGWGHLGTEHLGYPKWTARPLAL